MEIWEIENIIHNLQIKLDYLTSKRENNHYQAYGTDVKYEYGETTIGSKQEIEEVKSQIAHYQEALERKKAIKRKQETEPKSDFSVIDAERQKREEERQKKQDDELERLETFKQVKESYKKRKGKSFRRLMDRISGNSPKWKQVRTYTKEELEFALKSLSGETTFMKNRNKHETDFNKISNRNWNNFINILNKKYNLKQQMEIEKGGLSL